MPVHVPPSRAGAGSARSAVPVSTTPRVTVLTSVDGLTPHLGAYERLAADVGAPASVRWATLGPWLRLHPWCRPLAVLVHRGPALVAAVVLAAEPVRVGWRVSKVGIEGEPFALLHADDESARLLADGVRSALEGRRWWLWLTDLPAPDVAVDALAAGLARVRRSQAAETPVLDVSPVAPARDRPSRNTRQAAAKARNRVEREGHTLTLDWVSDPGAVSAVLPELIELHVRRNEHLNRAAILLEPAERELFAETVAGHGRAGDVRLLCTRIDGALAAFALCLVSGRRWWVYANYADPAWLHFSPGTVTNAEVVRTAHADPTVDELDWGAGIQRYKLSGGARLTSRQLLDASSSATVQAMRRVNQALMRATRRRADAS